ncbi:MAG: hypothetical protein ACI4XE_01030, partial [Acutalibacteraceae bacterium]
MNAINLKTEYLNNPVGIDITKPRFFWNCDSGKKQTAYRIVAEKEDGTLLWDSGKVASDRMTHIPWGGKSLQSRDRVYWSVTLWDENGKEGEQSEKAFFEIGLLSKSDWKADWITGNYKADAATENKKKIIGKSFLAQGVDYLIESGKPEKQKRYPVDCFRRIFT